MAAAYAGDVSPQDAMTTLTSERTAVLIDVRSRPEWQFVGVPDLSALGKEAVLLEWQAYPTMAVNGEFAQSLRAELDRKGIPPDSPLFFLCRSGARSRSAAAAMASEGYTQCFNVTGGFEGAPDQDGHRGTVEGWKALRLPWSQN